MLAQRQQLRSMFGSAARLPVAVQDEKVQVRTAAEVRQGSAEAYEASLRDEFGPVPQVVDKDTSKRRFQAVQRLEESRHLPAAEAVARPAVGEVAAAFIHTGLPDALKAGVKDLTGMALDHVRVHYNSR